MNSDTCNFCNPKYCKNSDINTFDICQYGVSYLNTGKKIISKEPKIPLSTIAKNLRHEINPILQSIIEQTSKLDNNLSTKIIDLSNPLSKIIGNTVILDHFIQMITGVHEFHSTPSNLSNKKINILNTIEYYYHVYSIIKESGRNEKLNLKIHVDENKIYLLEELSDFIKYMISILIDNAWKYSKINSNLDIYINENSNYRYDIIFENISNIIPEEIEIFKVGIKADDSTKGFGYGLYWLNTLKNSYNEMITDENLIDIKYKQTIIDSNTAKQGFTIENLNIIIK